MHFIASQALKLQCLEQSYTLVTVRLYQEQQSHDKQQLTV